MKWYSPIDLKSVIYDMAMDIATLKKVSPAHMQHNNSSIKDPRSGTLDDCRNYVSYQFLLHHDYFEKTILDINMILLVVFTLNDFLFRQMHCHFHYQK